LPSIAPVRIGAKSCCNSSAAGGRPLGWSARTAEVDRQQRREQRR
jgi:hypothetical protein